MSPEEREKLTRVCTQIQVEKDPTKFSALIKELEDLLAAKERRLREDARKDPLL